MMLGNDSPIAISLTILLLILPVGQWREYTEGTACVR